MAISPNSFNQVARIQNKMDFAPFKETLLDQVPHDLQASINFYLNHPEKAKRLAIKFLNDYFTKKDLTIKLTKKYIPSKIRKSITHLKNHCFSLQEIKYLQKVCKILTAIHVTYVTTIDNLEKKELYKRKIEELTKETEYPKMGILTDSYTLPIQTFHLRSETEQEIFAMYDFDGLMNQGSYCKKQLK